MQEMQEVEKQLPPAVSQGQSKAKSPEWKAESSLSWALQHGTAQ